MDMLVYIFIILILGFTRVYSTRGVSEDADIVNDSEILENSEVQAWQELPIGDNLKLSKNSYAFRYILFDLDLEKP